MSQADRVPAQQGAQASAQLGEILEDGAFSADDLSRACGVSLAWVHARVAEGILAVDPSSGAGRFGVLTLMRARRIAQLESTFDADPQLAALTADLMEEVVRLSLCGRRNSTG